MTATITKLRDVPKIHRQKAPKPRSISIIRKYRRQALAGTAVGVVAGSLVALSLTHLAHGIGIVTAAPAWESWSMAVGVDLGFVALEMAQLTAATDTIRKAIGKYSRPAIIGLLAGSATLNAFAFASQATGALMYPAIALGLAIPALIFALTKVGAIMWVEGRA